MRRILIVLLCILLQGCLGPPDTFGDMWERVDEVAVPEDFTLIAKQQMGLRGRFMAAPGPTASNYYSAAWDDGELCERLRELLAQYGPVEEIHAGNCGYETTIPSGWTASLVNVWTYQLWAYAIQPEDVMRDRAVADDCAEERRRDEEQSPGNYHSRYVPCWVTPGGALVKIMVNGKVGW